MKYLFLLLFFLVGVPITAQPLLNQLAYTNDTTYSTSSLAINDTSTTPQLLIYGDGTADFRLQYAVYFNGTWSDTVNVDTVYSAGTPYFLLVNTISTDSLKKTWLPFISPAPYYYSILKSTTGWQYKYFINTKLTGNSGVATVRKL